MKTSPLSPDSNVEDDVPISAYQRWIHNLPGSALDGLEYEDLAADRVREIIDELVTAIADWPPIWGWGDGHGGCVLGWLDEELRSVGLSRIAPKAKQFNPPREAPPVPWPMRYAVMERDGFRCQHCGCQKDLTMDHDVPQRRGGRNSMENLQTLCKPCNSEKGTKTDREWIAWRASGPEKS